MKTVVLFLLSVVLLNCTFIPQAHAAIIPPERRIDWQGTVGVEGGIPIRTAICQTLNPGDNIQTALNNCPTGQVVYMNEGTYTVTKTIVIPASRTLRGAGMDKTIILSNSNIDPIVRIGSGYTEAAGINIQSGYNKGSNQIVVASSSTISVGDLIRIDELNDAIIPVTQIGYEGACGWCSRDNGNRVRAQVVKVTAKNGNTLDITPALFFDSASSKDPQIQKLQPTTKFAGVEDLTIKNSASGGTSGRVNLNFYSAENCWAKNIKIDTCGKRGIDIRLDNYRIEIRDSYIERCLDTENSDTCYGLQLGYSSSCLIENNIFYDTSDGPMLMWGASGNVVSYNYLYDVHKDRELDSWFWPDALAHGAHTSYNLYEGNIMVCFASDFIWGSNSHNTFFRNQFLGKHPLITWNPGTMQTAAFGLGSKNNFMNIVGNVLGTSGFNDRYEINAPSDIPSSKPIYINGMFNDNRPRETVLRHANYDYYSNSVKYCDGSGEPGCQGGDASKTLPTSLYLPSKPSWWCSDLAWPAIGPDLNLMAGNIPAKVRYEGGVCSTTTAKKCAELGGTCCQTGQVCSGATTSASDCASCCIGTCQTSQQTCFQQGGNCCTSGQTCSGSTKTASDCTACCIGTCQSQQQCISGDLNCDGTVNIFDLVLVAQNYGKNSSTPGFDSKADANKDGIVNIFDLVVVAQNYGKTL
ncbi:MAG: dockerin type I domain-containing protein [Candidatus Woesearchaeota archaeon]